MVLKPRWFLNPGLYSSYLRQNFSESFIPKTKAMEKGTCYRSTYTTGSGILRTCTPIRYDTFVHRFFILVLHILKLCVFSQYAVRPFTGAMRTIAKVIGEFIEQQFQHDKTIEQNYFNNCVLITYLSDMAFPEHRDVTYTKKW